jgi:hypothetical protein
MFDILVKSPTPVTPANAGVQKLLKLLDSGVRRNDDLRKIQTFYETILFGILNLGHCYLFVIWDLLFVIYDLSESEIININKHPK